MKPLPLPHINDLPYKDIAACIEATKKRRLNMGYLPKKLKLKMGGIVVRPTLYAHEKYEVNTPLVVHGEILVCVRPQYLKGSEQSTDLMAMMKRNLFLYRFTYGAGNTFFTNHAEITDDKVNDEPLKLTRREDIDITTPEIAREMV